MDFVDSDYKGVHPKIMGIVTVEAFEPTGRVSGLMGEASELLHSELSYNRNFCNLYQISL